VTSREVMLRCAAAWCTAMSEQRTILDKWGAS
jgi:hypothetical protein